MGWRLGGTAQLSAFRQPEMLIVLVQFDKIKSPTKIIKTTRLQNPKNLGQFFVVCVKNAFAGFICIAHHVGDNVGNRSFN